jgi:hypothetical protein
MHTLEVPALVHQPAGLVDRLPMNWREQLALKNTPNKIDLKCVTDTLCSSAAILVHMMHMIMMYMIYIGQAM